MPCKARLRNKEPEIQDPGGEGTASFAGIIACGRSCRARGAAAFWGAGGAQGRPGPPKKRGGGGAWAPRPRAFRALRAPPPPPWEPMATRKGGTGAEKATAKKGERLERYSPRMRTSTTRPMICTSPPATMMGS